MKKVLCLGLVLCITLAVVPVLAESNMTYVYKDGVAYLTKYEGSDEEVVIDSFSEGYEVKVIGKGAFSNCESVKKVVIPDTVTTIGQGAFDNCASLEELVIPDSVTYIETGAFTSCPNLKKVVIGNGIKAVKLDTFRYCGIESLVVLNPETAIFTSGFYSVYTHGRELEYWHPGSFESCRIGTIYAPSGSKAEKYAKENNIPFKPLDDYKNRDPYEVFVIEEKEDGIIIKGLKKEFSEIFIPGKINGKQVEIGNGAFQNQSLKKVILDEEIKTIPECAFYGCTMLEEINLENIESIGDRAFVECKSLKEVNLLNIKSWLGVSEKSMNEDGTYVLFSYHERLMRYNVYVPYTPFFNAKIGILRIKWPETNFDEGAKTLPALFFNCNIEKVIFENFTVSPSLAEFKTVGQFAANPRWQEKVELVQKNTDMVIYSNDERVKEYAERIGVKFVFTGIGRVEVEPKIQSIHGGIVLRNIFAERITKIAESLGGTVIVSGNDIAVQKDGKSMAIVGDTVYYMENGAMVTENLFYNDSFLKIPEKALENVLGKDSRKSEEYKKIFRTFNSEVCQLVGTIETPYGTVAERMAIAVMGGYENKLTFVKWNGECVDITGNAPYKNPWSPAEWSKIELSEDGKMLTITYPEKEKKVEIYYTYNSPKRVLWDEGTYVITTNLETGEVACEIMPLKDKQIN